MRHELSDQEWSIIRAMLPTKPRGIPRVDDRRVLNGIFWVLRSGAPWRDLPPIYGPRTTCYNRFVRWRRAGIWDSILQALTADDRHLNGARPPTCCMHRRQRQSGRRALARCLRASFSTAGFVSRIWTARSQAHMKCAGRRRAQILRV